MLMIMVSPTPASMIMKKFISPEKLDKFLLLVLDIAVCTISTEYRIDWKKLQKKILIDHFLTI